MCVTCDFAGCMNEARWAALKLFGKGGTLKCCDEHKPDPAKRPKSLRNAPFFYDVRPLAPCAKPCP
jgi:hypothetical protein